MREELALSPSHPLTPTARQTALLRLLDALGRATLICEHLPRDAHLDDGDVGTAALAMAAADTYDAAADALTDGTPVDLDTISAALAEQRRTMVDAFTADDDPERRRLVVASAATHHARALRQRPRRGGGGDRLELRGAPAPARCPPRR